MEPAAGDAFTTHHGDAGAVVVLRKSGVSSQKSARVYVCTWPKADVTVARVNVRF